MTQRLYIGKLAPDARAEDLAKFFEGSGPITDCRVMTGFGFVQFESGRDADNAVSNLNGKPFMGSPIVVEYAKESRPPRERYDNTRGPSSRHHKPPGVRVLVTGISRDTSWQDLKDFGRNQEDLNLAVSYADLDRDHEGQGILEYSNREDATLAIKELDGKELRGRPVRIALDPSRDGVDNYSHDDRYRFGRDYGHREQHSKGEQRFYRRERSRSPYRADDRSSRFLPRKKEYDEPRKRDWDEPRRRDYDERRPAGYDDYPRGSYDDDRRHLNHRFERYRDDRRRDERGTRRDDKDDPYDDKATRHSNGDDGWAR